METLMGRRRRRRESGLVELT